MKLLIALFLVGAWAATAQVPVPPAPPLPPEMPVIMSGVPMGTVGFISHEFSMRNGKPVTGSPYAAEQVTEHVQTLADGNRIVNTSTTRMYRDGQGRTRTEVSMQMPGSGLQAPSIVTVGDPVAGASYMLNIEGKSATKLPGPNVAQFAKWDAEYASTAMVSLASMSSGEIKKQDLGQQQMEGVKVTGSRTTTTIPAGAMGNEQPIQLVSETWFSTELQMVMKSVRDDPRSGVTTITIKNLNRSEPDPSLFQVPPDYTVTDVKNMKMDFKRLTEQAPIK